MAEENTEWVRDIYHNFGRYITLNEIKDIIGDAEDKVRLGRWRNLELKIEVSTNYGDTDVELLLSGYRPESKIEMAIRLSDNAQKLTKRQECERQEYERLKKIYG